MTQNLANLEVKVLEQMYLKEIEILKFKLLSGAIVREIQKQKIKANKLALAIHKKQINDIIPSDYLME